KQLEKRNILIGGSICGLVMFFAGVLQQIGMVSTNAGKTAFITTLYIVLVPIFGFVLKHRPSIANWVGVGLGVIGLYFLCITEALTIAPSDIIILVGALFWAIHILCTDHFAPKVNVSKLVCIQSFVSGFTSLIIAFFVEEITMDGLMMAMPSLLYVGIMSTGFAFTFQALGQKDANATVASIILSTESLFAAISGYLILGEVFTGRELIGCILMFIAVIIAQLPTKKERKEK
ncbi:MAG: DMT family transporter, partial [Anaerovoracaceae bacterium]